MTSSLDEGLSLRRLALRNLCLSAEGIELELRYLPGLHQWTVPLEIACGAFRDRLLCACCVFFRLELRAGSALKRLTILRKVRLLRGE